MRPRTSSLTRCCGSSLSTRATVEGCTPANLPSSFKVITIQCDPCSWSRRVAYPKACLHVRLDKRLFRQLYHQTQCLSIDRGTPRSVGTRCSLTCHKPSS